MVQLQKIRGNIFLIIFSIVLIGLSYFTYDKRFGAFPSMVVSGDTITSADWNALVRTASSTNPYDVSFTGHLTLNTASSTSQTITNLWVTNFSPTTLTATNGTITNASSTYATIGTLWATTFAPTSFTATNASSTYSTATTLWSTTGNVTTLTATGGTITNASTTYATLPTFWGTTGTVTTLTVSGGNLKAENATSTASLFIPYGSMSLAQNGQVMVHNDGTLRYQGQETTQVLTATSSFSFSIASTTASEFIPLKTFNRAVTIKKVSCVNSDAGSPSVTWNIAHGTDSKTTTTLISPSPIETSTTTPTNYYTFNDNTIAAGEITVATTSASTGTGFFNCTLFYKIDP